MANHTLVLELWYDAQWNAAPVYQRSGFKMMRGTSSPGSDSDPAKASLTLDNRSGDYSPRSIASSLYGKIGQNTKARITIDGDVQLVGEVASWKPKRVKGDAWTDIEIAGALQRIGRGTDPLQSALTRAVVAASPGAYWPLDDGEGSTEAGSGVGGSAMTMTGTVDFAEYTDLAGTVQAPEIGTASLSGVVPNALSPANQDVSWVVGFGLKTPTAPFNSPQSFIPLLTFYTPGSVYVRWEFVTGSIEFGDLLLFAWKADGNGVNISIPIPGGSAAFDNAWHYYEIRSSFSATTDKYTVLVYVDGVLITTSVGGDTFAGLAVGGLTQVAVNPNQYNFGTLGVAQVYAHNQAAAVAGAGAAVEGYSGETAADRFVRLCNEQAITPTVVGDPDESVAMGPQLPLTLLGEFDEIGRTDDASIFETKDDIGLTMRTGYSKLNQEPAFTISYLGQIEPTLVPVFGDEGIRNDVTANNPNRSSRRVQQLTGPHNVQLPEDDPQGVGRYQTGIAVNTATDGALSDAAGWRVNLGTFNGTWYAEVTADLDAAPGIASSVAALDIGDVLAISDLPVDEALDTVECLIIGIAQDMPDKKRRKVTFFCVPATPYQIGVMAETSGDTGDFLGHADTDDSTTNGATLAGAATFSVATNSGPIWTTDSDDFPLDVVVGGQRVSVSSISGASSPQTFTVQVGGHQIEYAIPAGTDVTVHQPIILAL